MFKKQIIITFLFLKYHKGYLNSLLSTIRNVKFDNYKYLDYNDLLVINTKTDKIVKKIPNSFENSKKYYLKINDILNY